MEFFDFFCKISFFECNHSKTVSAAGVFQDMKNVKKIGQVLLFLANLNHVLKKVGRGRDDDLFKI
jgi:hypothetical protein